MSEPTQSTDPEPADKELSEPDDSHTERQDQLARPFDWQLAPSLALHLQGLADSRANLGQLLSNSLAASGAFKALSVNSAYFQQLRPMMPTLNLLSQAVLGNSMLSSTIAAASAHLRVQELAKMISPLPTPAMEALARQQLGNVNEIARLLERHNALLAGLRPSLEVAKPVVLATRAWQDAVRAAPPAAVGPYLERLTIAGRGTGWALQAGVALTETDDVRVAELEAEASVALGPAAASTELRLRLRAVDPSLCDRLDGAWERIQLGGANATSQAAHSLMETVDWTLRLLAPDDAVLAWHAAENRPGGELHEGRPTRSLRLRYVVRDHPEKDSTLKLYVKTIQELVSVLQAPKHGLHPVSPRALASTALAVEGLLHFMLAD